MIPIRKGTGRIIPARVLEGSMAVMKSSKAKKKSSSSLERRLSELEEEAASKGIRVRYDRLEAAGLKLKGGVCKANGEYHLFIDKRRSTAEKIDTIQDCLNQPLPKDVA